MAVWHYKKNKWQKFVNIQLLTQASNFCVITAHHSTTYRWEHKKATGKLLTLPWCKRKQMLPKSHLADIITGRSVHWRFIVHILFIFSQSLLTVFYKRLLKDHVLLWGQDSGNIWNAIIFSIDVNIICTSTITSDWNFYLSLILLRLPFIATYDNKQNLFLSIGS